MSMIMPTAPPLHVLFAALLLVLTGCGSDPPPPQYPPGSLPSGYGQASPGYGPQGYPAATPAPQVGSAVTPFGELLKQIPPLSQWPQLPSLAELPQLFPQWPWPAPPPAAPGPGPAGSWPPPWVAWEDEVLRLTNQQRAMGANCGGQAFGPAPPVSTQPQLRRAARGHGDDMARRDYFDHRSPEGTGPMQRAQAAGFQGGFVGENIAAGQRSPQDVVRDWVESPGHCVNLMNPRYRYLGVGYVYQEGDQYGHYWVQNFGG